MMRSPVRLTVCPVSDNVGVIGTLLTGRVT